MKTAIYIEDGTVQLVITPETEFEKNALTTFRDKPLDAKLFAGAFYDCRGGWVMQTAYRDSGGMFGYERNHRDDSLILVAREREPEPPPIPESSGTVCAVCGYKVSHDPTCPYWK